MRLTSKATGSGLKKTKKIIVTTNTALSNASVTWQLKYNDNDADSDLLDISTAAIEGHILRFTFYI